MKMRDPAESARIAVASVMAGETDEEFLEGVKQRIARRHRWAHLSADEARALGDHCADICLNCGEVALGAGHPDTRCDGGV